jgi:hypothetical protein
MQARWPHREHRRGPLPQVHVVARAHAGAPHAMKETSLRAIKWISNQIAVQGPSFGHAALSRKEKSNFKVRCTFLSKYFICVRWLSLSARCWVVRAGVILFKSFHVSLPAYVDVDSRPAHALPNLQKSMCAHTHHEFNDHIGIFRRISSFLHIIYTLLGAQHTI